MLSTLIWFFLSLKGRVSRQEFVLGFFGLVLVDMLVIRLGIAHTDSSPRYDGSGTSADGLSMLRLLLILSLWPIATVLVKRLHDLNVSGWWALTVLAIPHVAAILHVKYWIPYLALAVTLSALPGAKGDNRFGRDPLARAGI